MRLWTWEVSYVGLFFLGGAFVLAPNFVDGEPGGNGEDFAPDALPAVAPVVIIMNESSFIFSS